MELNEEIRKTEMLVEALEGINLGRKSRVAELEDKLKCAYADLELSTNAVFLCSGRLACLEGLSEE